MALLKETLQMLHKRQQNFTRIAYKYITYVKFVNKFSNAEKRERPLLEAVTKQRSEDRD
jgi:hypothetical protein